MPSISQLAYILKVHETAHFGQAARQLGVSQPTLSTQIRKAEDELGMVVFDRNSKPIAATAAGRQVIELAREVVEAHQNLMNHAQGQFAELAGPLSVGVIPTLAPFVLPWFLQHFAASYPKVQLSLYEQPTDELLSGIARNRMDAAILATPLHEASLVERVLFYDPFYLYANHSEAVLEDAEVDVEKLDARKLWLLEDGHCFRTQVISFCGLQERIHLGSVRFAGGSFETIRRLVDSAEGYTLVPETYAQTLSPKVRQRCVRAFRERTPIREVSLVHHRKSWKTAFLDALTDSVASHIPRPLRRVGKDGEVLPVRAS